MTEMQRQVQTMMRGFLVALSLAIVAGIALMLSGCRLLQPAYTFHGSVIETPIAAAPLNLKDQRGQPFQLNDVNGQAALIFFGYTHCPDVCPTTLGFLRRTRAQLGSMADRTRVIFVTVDPERDTSESLNQYLSGFDPSFIGLSGNIDEMETVWKGYGVFREKADHTAAYAVNHSTRLYLVDPQGRLRVTYSMDISADALVADVQQILQEQ